MRIKIIATLLTFCAAISNAQSFGSDSTSLGKQSTNMTAQQSKAQTIYSSPYAAGPAAPPVGTNVKNVVYGTCPAGFLYNGSTIYPVSETVTTTYTVNGQVVGKKTSEPLYYDNDCTKTEKQTLSCPAGYSGSISQSRKVSTDDVTGYAYGPWTTTSNTCTPPPPPPPPVPVCSTSRSCEIRDNATGECLVTASSTYCSGKLVTHCRFQYEGYRAISCVDYDSNGLPIRWYQ